MEKTYLTRSQIPCRQHVPNVEAPVTVSRRSVFLPQTEVGRQSIVVVERDTSALTDSYDPFFFFSLSSQVVDEEGEPYLVSATLSKFRPRCLNILRIFLQSIVHPRSKSNQRSSQHAYVMPCMSSLLSQEMKTIDDIGNLATGIQFPSLFSLASLSVSEQSSNFAGAPHLVYDRVTRQ